MNPILLSAEIPPLVSQFALVLVGAAAVGYLFERIGLIPIIGYLITGAIVGPFALGVVSSTELVDQMADIGVIFLLFAIGLELSGDQLRRMGWLMFGGGMLQVTLAVVAVTAAGILFGVDAKVALYTGCLISLSSTAVVLKLLSSRGETGSPVGDVAIAFLIFQDIAVVVMVLLVPMLGSGGGDVIEIVLALVKSLALIAAVLVATRWIVPPLLAAVSARTSGEEFLLAVLAIGMGVAWVVTLLGLSASLGAFIAGLVVSSGPHRERATRYVEPFQVVFAAIFFVSIGMLIDLSYALDHLPLIAGTIVAIVLVKGLTTAVAARAFRQPWLIAVPSALLLAQVGEFSFVLERAGRDAGLSPFDAGTDGSQTFIATSVALLALTPALHSLGGAVARRFARPMEQKPEGPTVVLLGAAERFDDLRNVLQEQRPDVHVVLADASGLDPHGPSSSRPVLLVVDESSGASVEPIVRRALGAEPPVPVVVRAWSRLDAEQPRVHPDLRVIVDEEAGADELRRRVLDALPGTPGSKP